MLNEIIKKHPIIAIDLGTTKFCAARLSFDQTFVLDVESVPAAGMHRGMLANFDEAATALCKLVETVEKMWNCDLQRVVTGIAGSHLFSERILVTQIIHGNVITNNHLNSLYNRANATAQRKGHELLHTIALQYRVDEREWMETPLGFTGHNLSAHFLGIYCDETYLHDVIRLMNKCGLQVDEVYAEPFASATVSVNELQRERGCVVADIGGGTTDGIVFQNRKPVALFTVNVAGNLMSKDLAIGLKTDLASAEKVKKRYGLNPHANQFSIQTIDGENTIVSPDQVHTILGARIQELGSLLVDSLRPFKGSLPAGIILTGGGAQVIGIEKYLKELLRVDVQRSLPVLLEGSQKLEIRSELSSSYATVIGLLNLEISRISEKKLKENHFWPTRYLERFIDWIRELS